MVPKIFMDLSALGSLWAAEGCTVLGKIVKDRERPNGNTTELIGKDRQRRSATHKD